MRTDDVASHCDLTPRGSALFTLGMHRDLPAKGRAAADARIGESWWSLTFDGAPDEMKLRTAISLNLSYKKSYYAASGAFARVRSFRN